MLDIIIAGLLIVLILASILRRGIQQLILIGLLVLLGVIAIARLPGRFTDGLGDARNQTIEEGEVDTARAAFRDATLAIGALRDQSDTNIASQTEESQTGEALAQDPPNPGNGSVNPPASSQEQSNPPTSTNPPTRAWW